MIIDKTIGICIVCENSWFCRKDKDGKLLLPVKCPACSSPNWNKKRTGRFQTEHEKYYKKTYLEKATGSLRD